MIVKFLTIIGFLSFLTHAAHIGHYDYYDEPTHYSYGYRVNDPHTGDEKMHHETKIGDVVKGFYRVKEADGTFREVHYTADKHNGFQAHVKKIGHPIPNLHHHLFKFL